MSKTTPKRTAGSGNKTRQRLAASYESSKPHFAQIETEMRAVESAVAVPKSKQPSAVLQKSSAPKTARRAA